MYFRFIKGPDLTSDAVYLMDKAYIDFMALYRIQQAGVFFVTRAKSTIRYSVIEQNFNIDESIGLRTNKTVQLIGYKSKTLYPKTLRLVEFCDNVKNILLVFLASNFDMKNE